MGWRGDSARSLHSLVCRINLATIGTLISDLRDEQLLLWGAGQARIQEKWRSLMTVVQSVFHADDHPFIRDGVRLLLEREPDLDLVGTAANGDEACRLVMQL